MATVAQATYDILRAGGLTTIFGNPGSNELKFLAAMPTDFRYVLGLHEGAVISMADGFALASGEPVLVNLHAASGSGNAMGGLTNAVYSHSPLVVTAGQQVRSTIGQEVMLANVDAAQLARPLVKWSSEPACAQDVPRTIAQAVHTATSAPRGPVYVSVPYDDWDATADPQSVAPACPPRSHGRVPGPDQLADLVEALAAATNPALVVGPQVDAAAGQRRRGAAGRGLAGAGVDRAVGFPLPVPDPAPGLPRGAARRGGRGRPRLAGHDLVLVVGAPVFRYHQYEPGDYLPEGHPADPADRRPRRGRPRAGRRRRGDRREGGAGPARRRRARPSTGPRCHRCPTSRSPAPATVSCTRTRCSRCCASTRPPTRST